MTEMATDVVRFFAREYPTPVIPEDWEDVLGRAGVTRRRGLVPLRTMRLRLAVIAVAACVLAAAWLASTILSSSPGLLERAQAALARTAGFCTSLTGGATNTRSTGSGGTRRTGHSTTFVYRTSSGVADCVIGETEERCWNPDLNQVDVYRFPPPEPGFPRDEPGTATISRRASVGH